MVPEPSVISTESGDAHPNVLSSAVARRILSALSVQSVPRPALQGTMVAASSAGQCPTQLSGAVFSYSDVLMMMMMYA